jgi:hypothetical protein
MIAVEPAEILDEVIELLVRFLEQAEHAFQDIGSDQQGGARLAFSFRHAGAKRCTLLTLAHKRFGNEFPMRMSVAAHPCFAASARLIAGHSGRQE